MSIQRKYISSQNFRIPEESGIAIQPHPTLFSFIRKPETMLRIYRYKLVATTDYNHLTTFLDILSEIYLLT